MSETRDEKDMVARIALRRRACSTCSQFLEDDATRVSTSTSTSTLRSSHCKGGRGGGRAERITGEAGGRRLAVEGGLEFYDSGGAFHKIKTELEKGRS